MRSMYRLLDWLVSLLIRSRERRTRRVRVKRNGDLWLELLDLLIGLLVCHPRLKTLHSEMSLIWKLKTLIRNR